MKTLISAIFAALVAGTAGADVPSFAARCSTTLKVDANAQGQVYVNGRLAKLVNRPDGQVTASVGGVYIDITPQGDQPPLVRYTARDKSTGTCEILSFKAASTAASPGTGTLPATVVPAAPDDGGPRDWEVTSTLNLREQPSASSRAIARFGPGTILDNLGCQRVQGRVWCDVQQLGGGPRGYVAVDYLRPAVSPDGSVATGPDDSALRAGQGRFDANGPLPCAQSPGQPMVKCAFGVARAGGGYATVVITKPDGRTRAIYFRMGRPIGADVSEAEGRLDFSATKKGDVHRIRIGDERYEIIDAIVLGG